MLKTDALKALGADSQTVADAIGCSRQAVEKWPDVLPKRIVDRVIAAVARKERPAELLPVLNKAYGKRARRAAA